MDFSKETQITARKYNLEAREVALAYLIASGFNRADSYSLLYVRGAKHPSQDQANLKAAEILDNNPGMKVLIQRLKNKRNINTIKRDEITKDFASLEEKTKEEINEEVKKFTDKSFIIAQLAKAAKNSTGKELAQILMNIADLQRMKQEEVKEDTERRLFYLPYISHCRTCKLMQLFKEFMAAGPV